MSWSAFGSSIARDDVGAVQPPSPLSGEPAEQLEQARQAAVAIIDSGAVGDPASHRFNVSLSGHANPGHEPQDGYSNNDAVSISIGQATPAEE